MDFSLNGVEPLYVIGAIVVSYFLGTTPSALMVAKRGGVDVPAEGSGIPGTSHVASTEVRVWQPVVAPCLCCIH